MNKRSWRAKTPEEKRAVIERVLAVWLQHPALRLGQLLENVCQDDGLFYVEDSELAERLERWRP